jgi:hypothetical protein
MGPKSVILEGSTETSLNIPFIYIRKAMVESKRRWEPSSH